MTPSEIHAFNKGVAAVVEIAAETAARLRAKLMDKPTRYTFAIEALDGIVEAAAEITLAEDGAPT